MGSLLLLGAGSSSTSGGGASLPLAITSNGGESTASINYNEGLTSAITTVEAEGGTTPYAFSITGGADAAFFEINSSTGVLTPLAAFDYENPQDAGANNGYVVEVAVTDAALDEVSQTITVNVQAVEEPFVKTLEFDLTNFVNDANSQKVSFSVTYNDGADTNVTGPLNLYGGDGLAQSSVNLGGIIQQSLRDLVANSGVTVSGSAYSYTVSFPEAVQASDFSLDETFSQLFPTVILTESVIQQGVDGVQEVVSITADDPAMTSGDTTSDNNGNSVTVDATNTYTGHVAGSGWTAGSPSGNTVVFTKDAAGEVSTSKNGGNGTVTVNTEGAGTVEVHLISRNIAPTGGGWKPCSAGEATTFDASVGAIQTAIGNNFGGAACTADQTLVAGNVLITASVFGNLSDTQLAPVNVDLTAPAITVTIE